MDLIYSYNQNIMYIILPHYIWCMGKKLMKQLFLLLVSTSVPRMS